MDLIRAADVASVLTPLFHAHCSNGYTEVTTRDTHGAEQYAAMLGCNAVNQRLADADVEQRLGCTITLDLSSPLVYGEEQVGWVRLISASSSDADASSPGMSRLIELAGLICGLVRDVNRYRDLAILDPKTVAHTYTWLQDAFPSFMADAQRHGRPLSLVAFDLNRFKNLNTTFGRVVVDRLLAKVVVTVQETMRAGDFIARFGGDEFVVVAPSTDCNQAATLARTLQVHLAAHEFTVSAPNVGRKHESVHVSAGVGTATLGTDGDNLEQLLHIAFERVDQNKQFMVAA